MSNGKLPPVRNPAASLGTPLRLVAARSQLALSEPLRRSLKMPHPQGGWETKPCFPIYARHPTPCAGRNVWRGAKTSRRRPPSARLGDKRLDYVGYPGLLGPGQQACARKNLAQAACRSGTAALGLLAADELVGRDSENIREGRDLLGPDGNGLAFPEGVGSWGNPQLARDLGLGQARSFAQRVEASAERRTGA